MSNVLGVTTIGTLERPSIIAGDYPRATLSMLAAVDMVVGAVVGAYDDATGAALWDSTAGGGGDPPNSVLAIAAEEVSAGQVGVFWVSGEFIGERCQVADGQDAAWDAYWRSFAGFDAARKNNIYIRDARLAPNQ